MSQDESLSDRRKREKEEQRKQDEEDLVSGKKTREQLREERSMFAFPNVRIRWDLVEKF